MARASMGKTKKLVATESTEEHGKILNM